MNQEQARNLVRQALTQSFDKARFRSFVLELLNQFDESKARSVASCVSIDGSVIDAVLIGCPIFFSSFQDRTFQKNFRFFLMRTVQNTGHPNEACVRLDIDIDNLAILYDPIPGEI